MLFLISGLVANSPVEAAAGINQQINFQGRLFNAAGATVPDGYYNIQFKIYQDGDGLSVGNTTGSPAGSLKWTETYLNNSGQGAQVKNGFLSVQLGGITAFGSSIDWNQDTLWLSMNIAGTNGTCASFAACTPDGEMVPMKRMSANAYALNANNANQLGGKTAGNFVQLAQGVQTDSSTTSASIYLNKTGSTADIIDLQRGGADVMVINNSGQTLLRPTVDSTTALQIQKAGTTTKAFSVDTVNSRIGIGNVTPGYAVDAVGSVNASISVLAPTFDTAAAGVLAIGTTNATGINLNQNTNVTGSKTFTVGTGLTSLGGGLAVTAGSSDFTASIAAKRGTDYSTAGVSDDTNFANASLIRLTGSSLQTIRGIANGRDGYMLTIVNASSQAAILANANTNSLAANRILTGINADVSLAPDASVTLVYDSGSSRWRVAGQVAFSSANFIQNQNAASQGSSNFWISGTGRADTSFLAPTFDVAAAGTLSLGTSTATAVSIGKSGVTTTTLGALTSNGLLTGSAGLSASAGAVNLQGNAASQFTTSTGALTLTSAAAATWSTTAGNLTLQAGSGTVSLGTSTSLTATGALTVTSGGATALGLDAGGAAAVNIGTTNANAVNIGRSGFTTTNNGALTVTQLGQFNGGLTSAGTLTLTSAGYAAFQRGSDYSATTGTNDINFGTSSLIRLTGASTQTLTGLANGVDGRMLTIVNAAAQPAILANANTGSLAANRILTGIGSDIGILPDASVTLVYDSGVSRWRVVGQSAFSPNAYIQNQNTAAQTTGNFWISGTGRADTSLLAPSIDSPTATLNIATSTATTLNIATNGVAHTVAIANGAAAQSVTMGSTNTTSSLLLQAGTGNLSIQTQGGTLGIANNAVAQTLQIGNTTGATGITERVGTGNYSLDGVGASAYTIGASTTTGTVTIGGTAQSGTLTVGSSTAANTLNIAGGSGAGTVNIANVQNAGAVNIGAGMTTGTISIGGTGAQTGTIAIGTGTGVQALSFGNGGTGAKSLTIGSTASSSFTLIQSGTGDLQIQTQGTGTLGIGNNAIAQTLQVGNVTGVTAVTVQSGTGGLNLGTGNVASTIQIGSTTLAAGTQTINIGTNNTAGGTTNVTVGSNSSAAGGNTTVQAKGNVSLVTNGVFRAIFDTGGIVYLGNGVTSATPSGFTIKGTGSTTTAVAGGALSIQGGNATVGTANGGNVTITGGTGSGTGVRGLVVLDTPAFTTATIQNFVANGSITQANVDNSGAVLISSSAAGYTATLNDPTILTAGKILYVTNAGTFDMTLSINGGGTGNTIALKPNTSATMVWNGTDWTAAGASSSTDLQSAYNNTLTSAGGAELMLSKTSNADGLTIRDSVINAVNGALLEVQNSSAANLFSVNSNVTEYASNAGAETAGGTATTFPASTWTTIGTASVARNVALTEYVATGQASVAVTPTAANSGTENILSTTLTANTTYNVSLTTKLTAGSAAFTDMGVYYSVDGSTASVPCTTTASVATQVWTKVNCTFTTPTSGILAANAIFVRQIASATRTFYIDNLSVTIAADYNFATDGGAGDATNFATNWSYSTGIGAGSVTQKTDDGYTASNSAQIQITTGAINAGGRNKLNSNPLPDTLYRVTVYAKGTTAFSDFKVRYSRNNGTNFVDCVDYNTQTISTSAWTKVTCYIKTDATAAANPYVYFVEGSSAVRTYLVDAFSMTLRSSTTPNVQIGGGVNGGPTTLLTLDKGASAPIASDNDSLLGSMYYDTTLGKLQCYEADGWGACGSSPNNVITISPEYNNAVLHGTGIGTMTSDLCSGALDINDGSSSQPTICGSNETYNFYKWTSPQASAQAYGIYVTYQLPSTFKEFSSGQTSLNARIDSATNANVSYQIYRSDPTSGLTACGSAVGINTASINTWQTLTAAGAADPSTCSFDNNDSVVFKINMTANNTANAYVGNLNFTFSNK